MRQKPIKLLWGIMAIVILSLIHGGEVQATPTLNSGIYVLGEEGQQLVQSLYVVYHYMAIPVFIALLIYSIKGRRDANIGLIAICYTAIDVLFLTSSEWMSADITWFFLVNVSYIMIMLIVFFLKNIRLKYKNVVLSALSFTYPIFVVILSLLMLFSMQPLG